MEKKVILSVDTACDLGDELMKRYHVDSVCPIHIVYDDKSYDDGINIFSEYIYDRFYKEGVLPRTAAASIGEYMDIFAPFVEQGCEVVHVSLGSKLSVCYANAKAAAEQFEGVYVIDSQNLSTGIGLIVIEVAERIARGMSGAQIAEEVGALVSKSHASFVLDTLKFMAAGGRCSTVTALGANLLQIRPSIMVDNTDGGAMGVAKKYRGKLEKCVMEYVADQLAKYDDIRRERIFITHSGIDPEIVDSVRKVLEKEGFAEIFETRASCTITSHCGPNCIGILFMTK